MRYGKWAAIVVVCDDFGGRGGDCGARESSWGAGGAAKTKASGTTSGSRREIAADLAFEKYTLKNGLDVILSEDHALPLVSVNVWYHVGPAYEAKGRTGFAHLFEHMMFQGSEHVGAKAHVRYLEGAGATGINGSTNFDRTNYYETVPSNQVEFGFVAGERPDGIPAADAGSSEIGESARRGAERAAAVSREHALRRGAGGVVPRTFPKEHPYYGEVIGSHADIEAARLNDVRDFFSKYYTPNNASLSIAGDFDPKTIKAEIEKYFGTIPRGPALPKLDVKTPPITSERRTVVTDTVELPKVYMAWFGPSILTQGDAENDLLGQILGGGKTSRLYQTLVHDKQIAQDVNAYNQSLMLTSVVTIDATARPGVKPEDLEKAIDEVIADFRAKGPTQAEVDRARNGVQSQMIQQLQTTGRVADLLNSYNHFLHDPGYLQKDYERYEKVTVADVKKRAETGLTKNARVVVYGVPGKKVLDDVPKTPADQEAKEEPAKSTAPEEAWRAKPPDGRTRAEVGAAGGEGVQAGEWLERVSGRAAQAAADVRGAGDHRRQRGESGGQAGIGVVYGGHADRGDDEDVVAGVCGGDGAAWER